MRKIRMSNEKHKHTNFGVTIVILIFIIAIGFVINSFNILGCPVYLLDVECGF